MVCPDLSHMTFLYDLFVIIVQAKSMKQVRALLLLLCSSYYA